MGIGNTTSAAILTGLMFTPDASVVTGLVTGLSEWQMPVISSEKSNSTKVFRVFSSREATQQI